MPDFDPGQPLPDEDEQQVITAPLAKTAGGQAYVGAPSPIDPSQVAAEQAAAGARRFAAADQLAAFNAANPALAGSPAAPPPAQTPVTITVGGAAPPAAPAAPDVTGVVAPPPAAPAVPARAKLAVPKTQPAPALGAQQATERQTRQDLDAQQVTAQGDVNAARVDHAGLETEIAGQTAAEQAARAVDVQDATAKGQTFIDQRERERDAAVSKARRAKVEDYYSNLTAGSQITSLLGIIASGVAGGLSGKGGNAALDQYNKMVETDFQRQRTNIENLKDSAAMARAGVLDAQKAREILLSDVDAKYVASLRASEAYATQRLKALGQTEAQISGNAAIIDLRQKQADGTRGARQQDQDEYLKQLTTESTIKTQAATRAAAYANADESRAKAAVARATAGTKDDALAVRDTEGNPLGTAGNRVMANKLNGDVANLKAYEDVLQALASHIREHGQLYNPTSDAYKERERLQGEAVARGRAVMGLQASDAGQALEHQIVGGSGLGLHRAAAPRSLDNLATEARQVVQNRINTALRRTPDQVAAQAGAAPPRSPADAADQAALSWHRNAGNRNADPATYDAIGARLKARGLL